MFQIIGAVAEFERALIQERVRAGMRNAWAKGKCLGRPRVLVDASRIADLRAQGQSWSGDWFATQRFYHTLTEHELMTFALNGQPPDPIPNRPSTMDSLDRKTLRRLWKEDERLFGGRSKDDLAFHTRNGFGALTAEKEDSELLPALAGLELKRRVHHLSFWLKQLIAI